MLPPAAWSRVIRPSTNDNGRKGRLRMSTVGKHRSTASVRFVCTAVVVALAAGIAGQGCAGDEFTSCADTKTCPVTEAGAPGASGSGGAGGAGQGGVAQSGGSAS